MTDVYGNWLTKKYLWNLPWLTKAYSEPCQISKMEPFAKIVNG